MLTPTSLRAFTQTLQVEVPQANATVARRLLVATAERVRDETAVSQSSRAGVRPSYRQSVDGRLDAPLSAVRPDGQIVLAWSYLREIAELAVRLLLARGPERSRAWKGSIAIFVDDVRADVAAITAATRLIEVAPVIIYARRLEIGRRGDGRPFVISAPPHLVEETALLLAQRYRDLASIKHTYLQLASNARGLRGRARRQAQSDVRYPAIAIRPLPA
jgi:hypothetical protein